MNSRIFLLTTILIAAFNLNAAANDTSDTNNTPIDWLTSLFSSSDDESTQQTQQNQDGTPPILEAPEVNAEALALGIATLTGGILLYQERKKKHAIA